MRQDLHVHYSAELYDHYTTHGVEQFDQLTIARVLGDIRRRGGVPGRLLDIGTGTGVVPLKLASRAECGNWELTGADYFEDMLAIARENQKRQNPAKEVEFVQDDVHAMQFADASFDIALARSNIHHWRDPVQAFRETYRVLRPGGVAIFHEPRKDSNPEALAAFNQSRAEQGVEESRVEEKYSVAELEAFLAEAGLTAYTTVKAPAKGFASLGVEIIVTKPVA